VLGRIALALALVGCGSSSQEEDPPPKQDLATVETFTPPSPLGCSAAGAYDYCFAFTGGTPLAVRVELPKETAADAVGVVRFHKEDGKPSAVLDEVKFELKADRPSLVFYFQVYPATYTIDVQVDGASGTSDPVEVGATPIVASVTLQ
jgi:hypothetical protein